MACLPPRLFSSSNWRGLLRVSAFCLNLAALSGIASAQAKPSAQAPAYPIQNVQPKLRADVLRFRSRVEAALAEPHVRKASWGILVVDRDSGEILYEFNPDRLFIPASNT